MSFFADAPAELLYAMPGIGGAVTNTITNGSAAGGPLLGGGGLGAGSLIPPCEIPHGYFAKQGKAILIEGAGVYSLGTTIPTMKFVLCFDNTLGTPATTLCATGAFTVDTTSRAAMAFNFRAYVTATQVGVNGLLQCWGWLNWGMIPTLTTTVTAPQITYVMGPATTTPISFNTVQTTPVYLSPYASWSTSSTGPSITLTQMFCWGLNLSLGKQRAQTPDLTLGTLPLVVKRAISAARAVVVLTSTIQAKVIRDVPCLNTITVVNQLVPGQRTAQHAGHDHAVFQDVCLLTSHRVIQPDVGRVDALQSEPHVSLDGFEFPTGTKYGPLVFAGVRGARQAQASEPARTDLRGDLTWVNHALLATTGTCDANLAVAADHDRVPVHGRVRRPVHTIRPFAGLLVRGAPTGEGTRPDSRCYQSRFEVAALRAFRALHPNLPARCDTRPRDFFGPVNGRVREPLKSRLWHTSMYHFLSRDVGGDYRS